MSMAVDIISIVLALSGGVFALIGTIGLFRMPDFPARTHAVGIIDGFAILQMLIAIMLQYGLSVVAFKMFLIIILLGVTSPVALHAIFRAWRQGQSRSWLRDQVQGQEQDQAQTQEHSQPQDGS